MVCVQIKGLAMIQLDPAYAMKDLRGTFVQVTTNIDISNDHYKICVLCRISWLLLLDISCPGDHNPCSGNGICDLAIGECTCNEGHQGSDCSGENLLVVASNLFYIISKKN